MIVIAERQLHYSYSGRSSNQGPSAVPPRPPQWQRDKSAPEVDADERLGAVQKMPSAAAASDTVGSCLKNFSRLLPDGFVHMTWYPALPSRMLEPPTPPRHASLGTRVELERRRRVLHERLAHVRSCRAALERETAAQKLPATVDGVETRALLDELEQSNAAWRQQRHVLWRETRQLLARTALPLPLAVTEGFFDALAALPTERGSCAECTRACANVCGGAADTLPARAMAGGDGALLPASIASAACTLRSAPAAPDGSFGGAARTASAAEASAADASASGAAAPVQQPSGGRFRKNAPSKLVIMQSTSEVDLAMPVRAATLDELSGAGGLDGGCHAIEGTGSAFGVQQPLSARSGVSTDASCASVKTSTSC